MCHHLRRCLSCGESVFHIDEGISSVVFPLIGIFRVLYIVFDRGNGHLQSLIIVSCRWTFVLCKARVVP